MQGLKRSMILCTCGQSPGFKVINDQTRHTGCKSENWQIVGVEIEGCDLCDQRLVNVSDCNSL